jgi:hypothetical protein
MNRQSFGQLLAFAAAAAVASTGWLMPAVVAPLGTVA